MRRPAAAIVANTNQNTVSVINLGLLTGSSPATSLTAATVNGVQEPIAMPSIQIAGQTTRVSRWSRGCKRSVGLCLTALSIPWTSGWPLRR